MVRDIASEVTVQLEPSEIPNMEGALNDVVAFLNRQPGVRSPGAQHCRPTRCLSRGLVRIDLLSTLPVPGSSQELDRNNPT